MADGDIRISRHLGTVRTTATGGTLIPAAPSWPTLVDHDHWVLVLTAWRTDEPILNDADGPYIRSWQAIFHLQDNGTNVKQAVTINVLKAATAGNNADSINVDYLSGIRVWAEPNDTGAKRWFFDGVLYRGVHTVVSP